MRNTFHRNLVLLFVFGVSRICYAEYPLIQYEKSFTGKNQIDLSAIFNGSYSEIRWDSDGDGFIDSWSFSKGTVSVEEFFIKGKLESVKVRKREKFHNITLLYIPKANLQLQLVDLKIRPHKVYFDEQINNSFGRFSKKVCAKSPISKYIAPEIWNELISTTNMMDRDSQINALIAPSCRSILSGQGQTQLLNGLKTTYDLELNGFVEDNKVLNCLAQNQQTKGFLPGYIRKITADLVSKPKLQYACKKVSGIECGKPSYDEQKNEVLFPISDPPCSEDLTEYFSEGTSHEKFHQTLEDDASEKTISSLVEGCVGGNRVALKDVNIDSTNTKKELSTAGPSATKNAAVNQNNNLPPAQARELAAQPANIIATAGERSGTLNSGFRSIASASDNFNPNQAYRESVARTGSVFPKFEAAINAIVPPASAGAMTWVASNGGGSSKSSSSGGGQWLTDSAPTASRTGVSAQGADIEESRDKRSPSSVAESDVSSGASVPSQKANSQSQREVVNGKTRSGATDGVRSSGRAPNVDISSGSTNSAGNREAQEKKRASLSPQQKQQAVQLVNAINSAKNPNEVLALLQKNDSRLATLKVHVYDPKAVGSRAPAGQKAGNRKDHYGASQDEAAEFYSLINGKLVPE